VFRSAVLEMDDGLARIGDRVRDMANQGFLPASSSGGSYFDDLAASLAGIAKKQADCTDAESAITRTLSELDTAIARMQTAVAEIQGIEIQIQRIAINATIRSAQIGAHGEALNVIAAAMHKMALESNQRTATVAEALASMKDIAANQQRNSLGEADFVGQLSQAVASLRQSSEESSRQASEIHSSSQSLSQDICSLRQRLTVGARFDETVHKACEEIERFSGTAPSHSVALRQALVEHKKLYTMQSERDVHASVAQEGTVESGTHPVLAEGDLGSNIELF
jgi:chromosome segregation ATPase